MLFLPAEERQSQSGQCTERRPQAADVAGFRNARRRNLVLDRDGFLLPGLLRLFFVSAGRDLAVRDILCIDRRKRRGRGRIVRNIYRRIGRIVRLGIRLGIRLRVGSVMAAATAAAWIVALFRVGDREAVLRIAGNRSVIALYRLLGDRIGEVPCRRLFNFHKQRFVPTFLFIFVAYAHFQPSNKHPLTQRIFSRNDEIFNLHLCNFRAILNLSKGRASKRSPRKYILAAAASAAYPNLDHLSFSFLFTLFSL